MNKVMLRIGGEDSEGAEGRVFERRNPISKGLASRCAAASPSDGDRAAESAEAAFGGWSESGPNLRRSILLNAAKCLEERTKAIVEAMVRETGSSEMWAGFNVTVGCAMLVEAASLTTQIRGSVIPSDRDGTLSLAIRRPIGAALCIAPWNAPVILAARALALPLACGNTVILKGSERCPQTHRYVVDALIAAGVPPGVVNYINNMPADAPAIVEGLISHSSIRHVNFTGSTAIGRRIAELAARHLKPTLLELGGKAPMAILSDANINEAVRGAVFGAFFNQGQICMSTERIVVDRSIGDKFVDRFARRAAKKVAGDPAKSDSVLGSVVDESTVKHIAALVDDAKEKGARILLEGGCAGTIMQPCIVDYVTENMRLWREESFGPVVAIQRADGDEEIVHLANSSNYGLSAAVYGSDISRLLNVAGRIETGICHINGPTVFDEPHMPFGGVKDSGIGRFGGKFGIEEFTTTRWITINSKPIQLPM